MYLKRVAFSFLRVGRRLLISAGGGWRRSQSSNHTSLLLEGSGSLKSARELCRFNNYSSAANLFDTADYEKFSLADKLLFIRCLYGAGKGVRADELLVRLLGSVLADGAEKSRQYVELAECLRLSGLGIDKKIMAIGDLRSVRSGRYPASSGDDVRLTLVLFKLHELVDSRVDPNNFFDISGASEDMLADYANVIPVLFSFGHVGMVHGYIEKCLSSDARNVALLFRMALRYFLEWFDDKQEIFSDMLSECRGDLAVLHALHDHRKDRDYIARAFDEFYCEIVGGFDGLDSYRKDVVLRWLLRCAYWDEAFRLSSANGFADCALSKSVAKGFEYLVDGDYGAAYSCFTGVIAENRADGLAANGLRFTLPRLGLGAAAMNSYRASIGYGIKSAGRAGVLKNIEYTTVTMMSGNYLGSYVARRGLRRWKILESYLGERFYNYRILPSSLQGRGVFLVGDEGVGDEIRTAQYYGFLAENFSRVVVSCEPRLLGVFSRSFPSIEFIPVKRIIKVTATRADSVDVRVPGLHESIASYVNERSFSAMQTADCVTFGQNLMFNQFAGVIPRPASGGYLKWSRSSRVGNAPDKLKIGILWRSHVTAGMRKFMYLCLEDFAPLTQLQGVELWSIQHAMTEAEAQTCRDLGINLLDDVDLFNDFEAMAGCLLGLDLLIGISSVPMEFGAALGIETWMLGFSPENYYLRTAGGKTEVDQLTLNSTVVAPLWIDFTEPQEVCVREVFDEVKRRLAPRLALVAGAVGQVGEG